MKGYLTLRDERHSTKIVPICNHKKRLVQQLRCVPTDCPVIIFTSWCNYTLTGELSNLTYLIHVFRQMLMISSLVKNLRCAYFRRSITDRTHFPKLSYYYTISVYFWVREDVCDLKCPATTLPFWLTVAWDQRIILWSDMAYTCRW